MRLWQKVVCAWVLDAVLGDPPRLPHPVRLMGRLATAVEEPCRRWTEDERAAGVLAAGIVVSTSVLAAIGIERGTRKIHPYAGDLASVLLIYTCLAARDLATHAEAVQDALERGELPAAREAVSHMVGRDTQDLDVDGVVRAAVESVAENTTDGVVSPLFYAFLGGAPAVIAFKAVSTLDSTFGYKNDRYLQFGWASARADDAANLVPARLAVPFIVLAAGLLGHNMQGSAGAVLRDAKKHASPNSGFAEAAVAGALGVRLGGPVCRGGETVDTPFIGEPERPLQVGHIGQAVTVMWGVSALAGSLLAMLRGTVDRHH